VTLATSITLAGDSSININGGNLIAANTVGGTSGLTKEGAGTLELKQADSYLGATTVNGGTLQFDSIVGLGPNNSPVPVAGGATLLGRGNFTFSRSVQLADKATFSLTNGGSGTAPTMAGNITMLGEGFLDGFCNVSGVLEGQGGPSVIGFVTFTGTKANTYAGTTRVGNTLNLNRPGVISVPGELRIGEPQVLFADGAVLPTVLVSSNEQIADTAPITLLPVGQLSAATGITETIGPLTLQGGTLGANGDSGGLFILTKNVTVNFGGGDLSFPISTIGSNVSLGSATRTLTFTDSSARLDVTGNLSGAPGVGLVKDGPGLLRITGKSTYNGPTTVNGGVVDVTQIQLPVSTLPSTVIVNAGGTIVGDTFTTVPLVQGIQSFGGKVSPGKALLEADFPTDVGTLTCGGDFSLDAASHFAMDLDERFAGLTAGDQLKVTGAVSLGGSTLDLKTGPFFSAKAGDQFVIIDNDGTDAVQGVFSNLPTSGQSTITVASPIGPATLQINYAGGDGNDVVLTVLSIGSGPMFTNRSVTPVINEGSVATLRGTIVEPNRHDTFILIVDWSDGTPTQTFSFAPGTSRRVNLRHRFLDDPNGAISDQFFIHLSWHDKDSPGAFASLPITVHNLPPTVFAGPAASLRVGQTLDRIGHFVDPGNDTWTATVNFGDGSAAEPLTLGSDKQFRLQHSYTRAGTFNVTVTVTDEDGEIGIASFLVTVRGQL
jgi:autotransporter-associated beta strand protein